MGWTQLLRKSSPAITLTLEKTVSTDKMSPTTKLGEVMPRPVEVAMADQRLAEIDALFATQLLLLLARRRGEVHRVVSKKDKARASNGIDVTLVEFSFDMVSQGYCTLSPDKEEGICQVLAHMWIESEIMGESGSSAALTSSSSSSSTSSKRGGRSQFELKLGDFFNHQIESDTSRFRAGNRAVLPYGLKRTLKHIQLTGTLPF